MIGLSDKGCKSSFQEGWQPFATSGRMMLGMVFASLAAG